MPLQRPNRSQIGAILKHVSCRAAPEAVRINVLLDARLGHPFGSLLVTLRVSQSRAKQGSKQRWFPPVPYYLLGHSIELALKAFILMNGDSIQSVKEKLRHNN